jgi:hypothetical protein
MTNDDLRHLLRQEFAPIQAKLDGLPLITRSPTVLQQEARLLRAAFNDFARTNVTAGEIEALHADVNRVQAENAELSARLGDRRAGAAGNRETRLRGASLGEGCRWKLSSTRMGFPFKQ